MADLSCPAKKLEIDRIDKSKAGATYLVTGCGKTAQYTVSKKEITRTTDITAVVVPPPPPSSPDAPLPPQRGFTDEQFKAFVQEHDANFAKLQAGTDASMNESNAKPLPSQKAQPPSPARAAEPGPSPITTSASEAGYVCLNGDYYACPNAESTTALAAYGTCRFKCAMGGNCGACRVGAGEQCKRDTSRDSSCN